MIKYSEEVILAFITKYITDDYAFSQGPKGRWINIRSPFIASSNQRCGINIDEYYVNDYKLGTAWKLEDFFAEALGESTGKIEEKLFKLQLDFLKGKLNIIIPEKKIEEAIDLDNIPSYLFPKSISFLKEHILRDKYGRIAWTYLHNQRYLENKHYKKYNLSYVSDPNCWHCGGTGRVDGEECMICKGKGKNIYFGRIIIPTYENEKLVYFQARDFLGRDYVPKIKNPKLPRNQVVYFYDLLKEGERIYIVEGPFDAMTLFDYNVTCTLGQTLSEQQIEKLLKKNPKEIVFVPDQDPVEKTRAAVIKNLKKNIKKVEAKAPNLRVGVYEWWKGKNKYKDINEGNVTIVDETKVLWVTDLKERINLIINNKIDGE
jgi:hypothetical protein